MAIADKLIVSDLGRLAADEGWVLALHDFCRHNHRLPNQTEQHRCKRAARDFDRSYADACRGAAGPLSASLKRLGDTFLSKRQKYHDMAYGVVA
jgi:hypothetical protein